MSEVAVTETKEDATKSCPCTKKKLMIDCYEDVLGDYIKFDGRLGRRAYWSYVLFNIIFMFICLLLDAWLNSSIVVFSLYCLLTLVPSFAAISRRLHDIGRNMMWGLFPLVIAPALSVVIKLFKGQVLVGGWYQINLGLALVSLVMCFVLTYFLMKKGDEKANKYGEPVC